MVAINPAKWAGIGKADQKAIPRISGEALARQSGIAHDAFTKDATDQLTKGGTTIDRPGPAMVDELKKRTLGVETAWLEKAKKGMADAPCVLEALRKDIAAGSK